MYITSNQENANLTDLRKHVSPSRISANVDYTPQYSTLYPYQLRFVTFHSKEISHYYSMTTVDPNSAVYVNLGKDEIAERLPKELHQHDFYELMFVLDGEIYQNIENMRHLYTAGSCCILNKNVRHTEEYLTDFRVVFLSLTDEMLTVIASFFDHALFDVERNRKKSQTEQFLFDNLGHPASQSKDYMDFIPHQNHQWAIEHVHNIFEEITKESLTPKVGSSFRIYELIYTLLFELNNETAYTTSPVKIGSDTENMLFNQIRALLEEPYVRHSRSEIEEKLNYSSAYLSRIVNKYTGLSLLEYEMSFRMKEAAKLLSTTKSPVSEIITALGFSNRTQFYKKFEEYYHATPAAYRKLHKKLQVQSALHL